MFAQSFGRLTDLALAGQKDQYVAAMATAMTTTPDAEQLIAGIDDGVVQITFIIRFGFFGLHRAITHLDRIKPTGHLNDRRCFAVDREVLGKPLGIDGCRSDNQLQIRALGQQLLEVAEQKIDIQAALVRLIENQGVVATEPGIALRLGEQDAVGHQLDVRIRRGTVAEANLVADDTPQLAVQFLRNAASRRPRSDTARLRMADQPRRTAPEFQTDFRNLRRLARAGFTANDDDLMFSNQSRNFGAAGVDRQIVGELRLWQPLPARQYGSA